MIKRPYLLFIIALLLFQCKGKETASTSETRPEESKKKPNIIYIIADDLGYGDLSVYGQKKFSTPHIDKLASEGMRFTQHYAGSTVCAPSRSALMTGLHTGHTQIRGNKEVLPEGQYPLADSVITLTEILKGAGYVTGAFGKWGLGGPGTEGEPGRQGIDHFFGYNCQRLAHNYYPFHLWDNFDKVMLAENEGKNKGVYAPELIHQKSLAFIEQNKDQPFFLFIPNVIPHAELVAPEDVMAKFSGKYLPEKEYEGYDEGENYRLGPYGSQKESHAAFAAMVHILDNQVGEIMAKLEELGLADNTIVMFTSDNGPHLEGGADPDYFDSNGPLKGYKRDVYEGGIRVPMIVKWPDIVSAGSKTEHISAFWDVMPTLAEIAGTTTPENLDGISFLPTLTGEQQPQHEYLYWEFHEKGGRIAVRKDHWKGVKLNVKKDPNSPMELYDLSKDIGEENDIANEHPEIVMELEEIMKNARYENPVFSFLSNP
ncbi:MAG: arylsulfatase [Cyclobacteriaceae bacterium]|nr:arylsulfatase [Cyclobacteriaceae bacterium]